MKNYLDGRTINFLLKKVNKYDFNKCLAIHRKYKKFNVLSQDEFLNFLLKYCKKRGIYNKDQYSLNLFQK